MANKSRSSSLAIRDQLIVRIIGQFIGPPFAPPPEPRQTEHLHRRDAIIIELMNQHFGSTGASNSGGARALERVAPSELVYAAV